MCIFVWIPMRSRKYNKHFLTSFFGSNVIMSLVRAFESFSLAEPKMYMYICISIYVYISYAIGWRIITYINVQIYIYIYSSNVIMSLLRAFESFSLAEPDIYMYIYKYIYIYIWYAVRRRIITNVQIYIYTYTVVM
jgi:hypothetical protein